MNRPETTRQTAEPKKNVPARPYKSPPQMRRKRPGKRLLMLLRGSMAIVCGLIALFGLLLIVLPMFRVKDIVVEGNKYYTKDEIIKGSGIEENDEILALNVDDAKKQIFKNCDYVERVKITRYFSKVRITVTEYDNVVYTEHNGTYYTINSDLRVISQSDSAAAFAAFVPLALPEVSRMEVGETVKFADGGVDMAYIGELIEALDECGTLGRVSSVDCSKKYSVSYVLENTARVELGKVSETSAKLALADRILSMKAGESAVCSVVNVSDLKKPTYRTVDAESVISG